MSFCTMCNEDTCKDCEIGGTMSKVTIVVESVLVTEDALWKACDEATDAEDFNSVLPDDAEVTVMHDAD